MSVKFLTVLATAALITTASAKDSPEYVYEMTEYGKEYVAAMYAGKLCKDHGVTFDAEYFANGPDNHWDNATYNAFMENVMTVTKRKMDALHKEHGHDNFCKEYIAFVETHYVTNWKPNHVEK